MEKFPLQAAIRQQRQSEKGQDRQETTIDDASFWRGSMFLRTYRSCCASKPAQTGFWMDNTRFWIMDADAVMTCASYATQQFQSQAGIHFSRPMERSAILMS